MHILIFACFPRHRHVCFLSHRHMEACVFFACAQISLSSFMHQLGCSIYAEQGGKPLAGITGERTVLVPSRDALLWCGMLP